MTKRAGISLLLGFLTLSSTAVEPLFDSFNNTTDTITIEENSISGPLEKDGVSNDEKDLRSKLADNKEAILYYKTNGDFKSEAEFWRKRIDLFRDNIDSALSCFVLLALAEQNDGLLDSAFVHLQMAAKYYGQRNDFNGLAETYSGLGNLYSRMDDHENAFKSQLRSLEIRKYFGDPVEICNAYLDLSIHYQNMGDLKKCLDARQKAYSIALTTNDETLIHFSQASLGTTYTSIGKPDSGLILLKSAAEYYEEHVSGEMLNVIYNGLAHSYSVLGDADSAVFYMEKTIPIVRLNGTESNLSNSLTNFGYVLYEKGDYKRGIEVCREGYALAKKIAYPGMEVYCLECLYLNFKGIKQTDSALFYYEAMNALENELDILETQKIALEEELKIEHSKETELITQSANKEIKQEKTWSKILVLAISLLIVAIALLFLALRQRRRSIRNVAQEKEYLDNLLHNLVHEFRTPLTLIKGPVEELLKNDKNNQFLNMVERNSDHMLHLVNQVLDFAKIKAGKLEVNPSVTDLGVFLADVYQLFLPLANAKGIKLELQNNLVNSVVSIDGDKLFKIVSNFVSNAIKYSGPNGQVIISAREKDNLYTFEVSDNGIGISPQNLERVFEKFYQVDATLTRKAEGTGLGLAFARELAELLNGKINIKSTLNKGTQISFELKADAVKLSATVQPKVLVSENKPVNSAEDQLTEQELNKILIVEDNTDLQLFLQALLTREGYEVFLAENGKIGIDKALEIVPDMIITDVMMPVVDGFQVVKEIKSNEKTDHIPILVLTAKASFDSRLHGLTQGADDYISKPFSSEELLLRVKNQLHLQDKLRQKFSATHDKVVPKLEENKFLQKIKSIMQADFTVQLSADEMAEKCAMSRSQMHRKLVALTGMSATALFNKIRLEFAYEDVLKTDLSISEIAYKYGYSDPSRFSKLFKNQYQVSPSDLRK